MTGDFEVRIEGFEMRESKNGEFVSLAVRQEGAKRFFSAFDGGSIDGDAVVLPAVAGGTTRVAAGDVVTVRVRVSAYSNAKGAWPSFTVLGTVSEA